MNPPENIADVSDLAQIPRGDGPVFPTPWTARAFALAVALNESGVFTWTEWADALGQELARDATPDSAEPQAYWRAWLATLEAVLSERQLAERAALHELREAWRRAAEATPHGEPVELSAASLKPPATR